MLTTLPLEQVAIVAFGVTAIFLTQSRSPRARRWSCIFGLLGQPFWFYAAYTSQQWGIFFVCCLYTVSWARGIWTNWIRPQQN